jgi:hypothetical protein
MTTSFHPTIKLVKKNFLVGRASGPEHPGQRAGW